MPEREIHSEPGMRLKHVPVKRLIARMGLTPFDRPAPMSGRTLKPKRVRLMLRQHVGKPSGPVVKRGDSVQKGQLIACIPEGALGAALHASIDGRVAEVTDRFIILKSK